MDYYNLDRPHHSLGLQEAQQAGNVAWELEELEIPIAVLIHDRDSK